MIEREPIESAPTLVGEPATRLAGRYELVGLLGAGGMGAVYRARDLQLGDVVALKMLRPDWADDPEALDRFRSEVRLARRVTHKNVARTFDLGGSEGVWFLTMECVDGGSLADRLSVEGPMTIAAIVDVVDAICAGLAAAHQAGVVHRDLKPENVLFARDGRVVVTDFGIAVAKDGRESSIVGTPAYMAPEQFVPGGVVDERADVYALGAVIFEMATGARAWKDLAERARDAVPDVRTARPDAGDAFAAVVARCMARDPARRFASALDVARELRASALPAAKPHPTRAMPNPTRSGKTVAVLPFANGGEESDAYIADGLTDDLIDTLSMTRGLLVRPRSVVARFRGQRPDATALGSELGVHVVVEGTVRRVATGMRIAVRLVGTDDAFQLWARRFDVPLEDLLVACDDIARAIAAALTTELPALGTTPADPAAIDLYLRAKQEFLRSWSNGARSAAELFERALEKAPNDARILSAAAQALTRMLFFGEGERGAVVERARVLTDRAVAVAPELGDTWAALASFRVNVGDFVGAARAVRTGLAHAPNSALLQDRAGRLFAEITPLDEAVSRLEIALSLDPTLVSARVELSRVFALRGDWGRSDLVCKEVEPSPALDAHRARTALWRGTPMSVHESPPDTYARLYGELDRDKGLTDAQRDFMKRRASAGAGRIVALFFQRNAEIHALMGEVDAGVDAIAGAVGANLVDLAWLDFCPMLAPLRTHPRFEALRGTVEERARVIRSALTG